MAKKSRLDKILEERKKQQKANTTGNTRTISTGLPSTRQSIAMPKNTVTEVQALAQSLFKGNSNLTQQQQNRVNSVVGNYQSIKNNGMAQNDNIKKAISNYNTNFRETGVISKDSLNKEGFLDKVKKQTDPKTQQKMLQQYNSLFDDNKSTLQVRKEAKDEETVNKINNGTTAEKVFNTAKFLGQGMLEGAVGTLGQINATAQNISRNTNYNKVQKMNEFASSYQQNLQNIDNKLIQFGGQVTNTVGGMLPSIGMNLIAPGTGTIMAGVSAGSSAYLETLNESQDNKGKAMLTGILKGTLAGTIEKIIGGNKIGTGALDDIAVKGIAKVKSQLAQKLLSKGYEVVGEVGEENLENLAGYLVDMAINNKKVTVEDAVRDLIDTTGTTAGATLLLNALGLGGGTFNDVQIETNKNNQIKNSGLTQNQQQKLTEVAEKYNLSQADIQNLIDNTKNGKYDQKQATTIENKAISEQGQQTIQTEGKIDKKAISQQAEQELKNTNYKREESVKRAFESAKKYNIDTKSDTFREKIRIADERGVDLVYDASVFGNNTNQNAVWKIKRDENGKIVSREIVFNPNAKGDMTLEQVWTHEITHDMEGNGKYKTMRNELLEYLQTKPEYEKAFNDLKAIYAKVYAEENLTEQEFNELIEDEVVADMLGSKLGDTEFLKSLNKEKRSLGKRIYDWVVDRLNILNKKKGYTNEKLFWQDIKNKFENAYKEDYVDSSILTKYSVERDNKEKQLEIILKNNPMHDDYHTGIRTIDDIKTYQEALNDDLDGEIQDLTPDFKANDLRKALETGEVTVYSSYPIEQGVFVTPSKMEAGSYAGNIDKVYSKKIKLSDVAWIDTLQGQYAKVEKNNDVKYSLSGKDSEGRKLSKEQLERHKDISPELIDKNGKLKVVYHTTTNKVSQFNEFNPVGTEGYRFGKQIVNYYTDSQEMSGSYADQNYKKANTKKYTTESDIQKYLNNISNKYFEYSLKNNSDGSYKIGRNPNLNENSFYSNLKKELENLKNNDKETYVNLMNRALLFSNPYELFENTKDSKIDDFLYNFDNKYGEYTAGETARRIMEYVSSPYEDINFKDEDDLFKNFIFKMQEKFPKDAGRSNLQYEGYLNMKKPYVIDAEGQNWNHVTGKDLETNEQEMQVINSLTEDEKKFLTYIAVETASGNFKTEGINNKDYANLFLNAIESGDGYVSAYMSGIRGVKSGEIKQLAEKLKTIWHEYSKDHIFKLAKYGFTDSAINTFENYAYTTNDIVHKVIEMNKNGANYDGVIIKNTTDYGGKVEEYKPANVYVTFKSNQFKSYDNTNPTENPDIRYSLSQETKANLEAKIDRYSRIVEQMQKEGRDSDEWSIYANEILRLQDQLDGNRFSRESTGAWNDFKNKYGKNEGKGNRIQDITLEQPKKVSEVLKPKKKVSEVLPKQEVTTTQAEKRQLVDEVYREDIAEGKVRKHYKSVFDSDQVGDVGKDVAKELLKKDTYVPISNLETITLVNDNISRNGIGATYNAFRTKVRSNEKITLQDVATGERLIQIYSQKGDYEKVNELIQDVAILGTELGQQVQALSLIKRASPEGQLQYLTKLLERTNIKENTNIKITDEMTEKILGAKNQEDLEKKLTEVAVELAEQLPVSKGDMIRSWRYLSMLGNPKTHIKNLGANVAMNLTQRAKNAVAGAIEGVASVFNPEMERTKTIKFANREQKQFAKQDAELMKDLIDAGGKYDVKNVIQESKKQFNNKVLNAIADFNSNLLDKEDKIFLKSAYKMAMQNYMSANNLKASDMEGKTLEKARQYASLQAQEATFHEFSATAQKITELENKGGIVGGVVSSALPFKKTPINIAKAGLQYSPVGLAKSVTYDIGQIVSKTKTYKQQLTDGKITEEQYNTETSKLVNKTIDNMAKGLTGTSIALLGYALAKMGILKAGNNGEDDEFEEKLGEQEYAITIGDNTYTLDWVSPSAIPLFVGATARQIETGEIEPDLSTFGVVTNAMAKAFEPMTEMSMLQGLTSVIKSYNQASSEMFFDIGATLATSYAGQFVPTVAGQVARIADPYERDTSSTKKGIEGKVDKFTKQTMNKIPGLSQKLPKKTDVWGEDVKRPENLVQRTLETAVLPWTRKKLTEDRTAQELLKVFDESGENVLPGNPNKDLTINKIKYRLTTEEYNEAKRNFGQTSKALLDDLFKSKTYNTLTAEGKAKAIDDVYAYAKEKIKVEYAEDNNYPVKPTNLYNTISSLEENNADVSAYFEFKGKIDDLDREKGEESVKNKEKMSYLKEMKTDAKTKRIIYEDTLGTNDEVYQNLSKLTGNKVNINQYLDYKSRADEFEADDDPKSNIKGKKLKGNREKKINNYINNSNFSDAERLYIYGTLYSLDLSERERLTQHINNAKAKGRLTAKEETELYKKLKSVEELEDGRIQWK